MSSTAVLSCNDLSRSYTQGNVTIDVLSALNFELERGQRCAIVGASGSGKSTLLALLGGLDKPTSGEVLIAGQTITSLSDAALSSLRNQKLGFVYQFHHLLPEFSAQENVALPRILSGATKRQAQADALAWLERVGLAARATHLPAELSGGERQRVAIARALINDPACVLMDEPTGNLDSTSSEVILKTIADLSAQIETAFVIVTHDDAVANVMDAVYRLESGNLLELAKREQIASVTK